MVGARARFVSPVTHRFRRLSLRCGAVIELRFGGPAHPSCVSSTDGVPRFTVSGGRLATLVWQRSLASPTPESYREGCAVSDEAVVMRQSLCVFVCPGSSVAPRRGFVEAMFHVKHQVAVASAARADGCAGVFAASGSSRLDRVFARRLRGLPTGTGRRRSVRVGRALGLRASSVLHSHCLGAIGARLWVLGLWSRGSQTTSARGLFHVKHRGQSRAPVRRPRRAAYIDGLPTDCVVNAWSFACGLCSRRGHRVSVWRRQPAKRQLRRPSVRPRVSGGVCLATGRRRKRGVPHALSRREVVRRDETCADDQRWVSYTGTPTVAEAIPRAVGRRGSAHL